MSGKKIAGIKILGYVDNLFDEYKDCRIVINPVTLGAGTAIKTIETFNMNRALISTKCGVRGLNKFIVEGKDYFLANTSSEFVEKISLLINDITLCNKVSHSALEAVEEKFSVNQFNNIVINTIAKKAKAKHS